MFSFIVCTVVTTVQHHSTFLLTAMSLHHSIFMFYNELKGWVALSVSNQILFAKKSYMYVQCLLSVYVNDLRVSVYSPVSDTHSSGVCWMKWHFITTFPGTGYGSWWEDRYFGMMVKLIRKPASYFSTLSVFFRCSKS